MNLPPFKHMLSSLVSEHSVSCTDTALDQSNTGVILRLADWCESLGFDTRVIPLPESPGKANLIATLGGPQDPGKAPCGLVLAGHTDTVPFDENLWKNNPLQLTEQDDRLYGLGSCDMKGFFAVILHAAAQFRASDLKAPLSIVATSDEESSMAGARHLAECDLPTARFAVVGEPTGLMPVYAHKGIALLSITLEGASGHSSDPELGNNALDAMHSVMGELMALRQQLAQQYRNPGFAVDVPTLNLGCLRAGDNPNRICGQAELQIDLRLLPGMNTDEVLEDLQTRISALAERHATKLTITPFYPPVPPFGSPQQGELISTLVHLSGNQAGTVAFGTEGPFFQALGMETAIFGPGSIDQAHQPDEYLSLKQIEPATQVVSELIQRYCVSEF